jgi:hypothetical protein
MNSIVLKIIQNIKVTVERVYLRIEDPYPFALGVLLTSITVRTADESWNIIDAVKEKAEIGYKAVKIEGFSIFMERDEHEVSIDEIIKVSEIPKQNIELRE